MKSKSILTFALATLVIGGLASCGPTTNPTTSDGGTTSVPPSGDTLEIQFWSTFNKSFHDQIETHINEFEKIILENEGVKIEGNRVDLEKYRWNRVTIEMME